MILVSQYGFALMTGRLKTQEVTIIMILVIVFLNFLVYMTNLINYGEVVNHLGRISS